jgi:hypothetical protein
MVLATFFAEAEQQNISKNEEAFQASVITRTSRGIDRKLLLRLRTYLMVNAPDWIRE